MDSNLGKLPPQAVDMEEVVLGAIMLEKDSIDMVVPILDVDDFYKDAHAITYEAILSLLTNNQPIDQLTVVDRLRVLGKLEMVGGAYYISELTNRVNSGANIEYHARIIKESSVKRKMIATCSNVVSSCYDDSVDAFQILDKIDQDLFDIGANLHSKKERHIGEVLKESLDGVELASKNAGKMIGIPSGIENLDKKTYGFQDGDMIIVAARPGMGKTDFMLNCIYNQVVNHKTKVGLFSIEMSSVRIGNRLLSLASGYDKESINTGTGLDWEKLINSTGHLASAGLWIDDTGGIRIMDLRTKARNMVKKHGVEIIYVDYLQLIRSNHKERYDEVSFVSQSLKNIAKDLQVPVIALAQLSRAVEKRRDKRPQLSDLKESGDIEQDADMVGFLWRPAYYNLQIELGVPGNPEDYMSYMIAKFRHGGLGEAHLSYKPELGKVISFMTHEQTSYLDGMQLPELGKGNDLPF